MPRRVTRPRATRVAAALAVAVAVAVATLAPAQGGQRGGDTGLWPTSFRAHQASGDCRPWKLDKNGFCVADDTRNGLEVGVKFRTSRQLQITGVRIYRFDTSRLTGSLWDAAGTLLATGTFAPGRASAWQDMTFSTSVTIVPGQTYVASYFTPKTKYAFRYGYFARSGRTVGPITALRSVDGDPNGVHCYDDAACGSFPVRGFRDSTYWVSPLWAGTSAQGATSPAAATSGAVGPRVLRVSPSTRSARVSTKVRITFSAPLQRRTLAPAAVRLLGPHGRVRARLVYRPAQRRVVLTPRSRLRPATTYRVTVTTRVRDTHGRRLDQSAAEAGLQKGTWRFRTR